MQSLRGYLHGTVSSWAETKITTLDERRLMLVSNLFKDMISRALRRSMSLSSPLVENRNKMNCYVI